MAGLHLLVVMMMGCVLLSRHGCSGGAFPDLLCSFFKDTFIKTGCVKVETPICWGIKLSMTRKVIFANFKPACDFFPCTGYGKKSKTCTAASNCAQTEPNGICDSGDVCCKVLVGGGGGGGGGGDGGTSGGSSGSGSDGD